MNIRKQIIKIAAVQTVLFALVAGGLAAHAGETIVAQVPFGFTLNDTSFPPGEYQFEVDRLSPNTVRVRGTESARAAIALSRRADEKLMPAHTAAIKFNVYGEQRFVSAIRTSKGLVMALRPGHQEALAVKNQSAPVAAVTALATDNR